MGIFNLEQQIAFYGAYHHNKTNQYIHMLFVPTILFSALVWLANTPEYFTWTYSYLFPMNAAFFVSLIYVLYYPILEPFAGSIYALFVIALCYYSNIFLQTVPNALNVALYIHVFSWIMQFIGHGVFEGRAPALLDNIFQAVFLAPLFVFLEALFIFGYRKDFQLKLNSTIQANISKWKKEKEAKKHE